MTNAIKNLIIVVLAVAVLLLLFKSCQRPVDAPTKGGTTVNTPKQYTDADGTVHTEVKAFTDADMANVNEYYQGVIKNLTDKLKGNVKPSDVKDATIITSKVDGKFKPNIDWEKIYTPDSNIYLPNPIDTSKFKQLLAVGKVDSVQKITYKDRWLNLNGYVHPDSTWEYTMFDSINIIGYEKKTGFLKREIFIDVTSNNPHTKIESLKAFRIQPKPKTWGIGISAGYIFDGTTIKPGISIGLTKTFIRW